MKRLALVAYAAGLSVLASGCSGSNSSALPRASSASASQATLGAGTVRKASTALTTTIPSGWAATGTQAIALGGATLLGPVASSQTLAINVALQLADPAGAKTLVARENTPGDALYGTAVTPDQFTSSFGPTSAQVSAVTSYLQSKGLTVTGTEPNNLFVSATGTAAQIEAAFNTTLSSFSLGGTQVFANTSPALVPTSLGGSVLAVLGLNNASVMQAPRHQATLPPCVANVPTSTLCVRSYNAAAFQAVYDAGSTPTGARTPVAVFAEGNVSQVLTDLRTYEAQNGLPQVPYSVVQVGLPSSDVAGLDEWDLDTQSSTGIAGSVSHLYVYTTTSLTDSDTALEFNKFVTQNVAKIGNASFGECESFPYVDGAMLADDQIFLQAAAQGQTVFASTGDTGSSCAVQGTNGVPGSGPPLVEYPAASPYVVGAGGTTLASNTDGTYAGEVAWNAGGGGSSQFEYSPYWQNGIVPAVNTTAGLRALPDVSMDADPNTGAIIIVNGAPFFVGGTSLSSPLSMGTYARFQPAHGNKLGFASPHFYAVYNANATASAIAGTPPTEYVGGFHDILTGGNGAYTALPRYDFTTGLGTFDISKVNPEL